MNLCVVETCRHHIADCPRDETCECKPALAAPGSLVCGWHADTTRENLRELPELWAVLGSKPSTGNGGGGSSEPPLPMSDRARTERTGMRMMLVVWCRILEEERGSPLPDERRIAQRTRMEVVRHQSDRAIAIQAYRETADHDAAERHLETAYAAGKRADQCLEARETDADIIEALREHIDRHLAWLLNQHQHADQLVHDVHAVHTDSRRAAYPSRPSIRILCPCGDRVPIRTESGAIITCPGCGEWGTLHWWRSLTAPPTDGPLALRDLPDWLFAHHGLVVTHDQLRHWARSDRAPHMIPVGETKGSTGRPAALYDPIAVAAIAQHRLGRRATA